VSETTINVAKRSPSHIDTILSNSLAIVKIMCNVIATPFMLIYAGVATAINWANGGGVLPTARFPLFDVDD
jgi:hypothetical protein